MVAIIKPIPCITDQIPFLGNQDSRKVFVTHIQYVWKKKDTLFGKF